MILYPFGGNVHATSGIDTLFGALSQCLSKYPDHFAPMRKPEPGDVEWYPVASNALFDAVRQGRLVAIGPNVTFGYSQTPGAYPTERELMGYQNYAAIFTMSRWYSELHRLTYAQKTGHVLLDYPIPDEWIAEPCMGSQCHDVMVYLKGGADEHRIADAITKAFPQHVVIEYGKYKRADLFEAARTSCACFYLSREDHCPMAALEIGLMGCPIISDEKACPVLFHRLTGIVAPVRERDTRSPFAWSTDAAARMIDQAGAAWQMDRELVRRCVIARHSGALTVSRILAALSPHTGGKR